MISFVPFVISYQDTLPDFMPKFTLSVLEIAPGFGFNPASLFRVSVWTNEEEISFGWDICFFSWLYEGWMESKEKEDNTNAQD